MLNKDKICSVENCESIVRSINLCEKHYKMLYKHGDALYYDKIKSNRESLRKSKSYNAFFSMHRRVSPDNKEYRINYYERGITVCERWQKGHLGLQNFINDMGEKPSNHFSLDRIDNSKGYSPENCKWSTRTEQNRNRRNTKMVVYNNELISLQQLCENKGCDSKLVYGRMSKGMDLEEALSIPKKNIRHKIEIDGVVKSLLHWSKVYGFPISTANGKIKKGKNIQEIIKEDLIKKGLTD